MEKEIINKIISSPKVIGIIADIHQGKSNCAYYLIEVLKENYKFNLFTYGLKLDLGEKKIYSVEELERIKHSIIIIDEYCSLFDLTDKRKRIAIEKTLRLIYHNNNILILIGVPENFKKFISSKLSMIFYGQCTLADFINGSSVKNIALSYKGAELGSAVLSIPKGNMLCFDGQHYSLVEIQYLEEYDTKKSNNKICVEKGSTKELKQVTKNNQNMEQK